MTVALCCAEMVFAAQGPKASGWLRGPGRRLESEGYRTTDVRLAPQNALRPIVFTEAPRVSDVRPLQS